MSDLPQRKYLQVRIHYRVVAEKTLGGVQVSVQAKEDVESLKNDGSSKGFADASQPDSGMAYEMLERIQGALLKLP